MIGQEHLRQLLENTSLSHSTMLCGQIGSGKKTFVREIICPLFVKTDFHIYELPDNKIDTVRDMIHASHKMSNTVFLLYDIDGMSIPAQNALLKIIEEPCNNNYFFLTCCDFRNVLSTIQSRCFIYDMDKYKEEEISQYIHDKYSLNSVSEKICLSVVDTPGDVDYLYSIGVEDFYAYTEKVVNNIAVVSGSNSFKIADKVAVKQEDGYDLRIFWKTVIRVCIEKSIQELEQGETNTGIMHLLWARDTSKSLRQLGITGINKQMLFDTWILALRKEHYELSKSAQ